MLLRITELINSMIQGEDGAVTLSPADVIALIGVCLVPISLILLPWTAWCCFCAAILLALLARLIVIRDCPISPRRSLTSFCSL